MELKEHGNSIMEENNMMSFTEKDFIQAKHRLEEAQARNRVKERAARTHRLIQEGAVLEKAIPQVREMSLEQLEGYLCSLIK